MRLNIHIHYNSNRGTSTTISILHFFPYRLDHSCSGLDFFQRQNIKVLWNTSQLKEYDSPHDLTSKVFINKNMQNKVDLYLFQKTNILKSISKILIQLICSSLVLYWNILKQKYDAWASRVENAVNWRFQWYWCYV